MIASFKEKKPFYRKNVLDPKKVFSWKELASLLNLRPFVNVERFHIISNSYFSWSSSTWCTDNNSWPTKIIRDQINKSVCYLSDCSRVNKTINDISKQIEKGVNWPTDAHIYFNLAPTENSNLQGFKKHKDQSHNLIVCIDGEYTIKIFSEKQEDDTPVISETLKKGDAVFVPAGIYHQVITDKKRLSISFPMYDGPAPSFEDRTWIEL